MSLSQSLFFIGLFILVGFSSCQPVLLSKPKAIKGVLDLSQWEFEQGGIIDINGECRLYWQHLLMPNQESEDFVFHTIPSKWNGLRWKDAILEAKGYATYRLHIYLNPKYKNKRLAFKIGYINTAYNFFLQNEKLGGVGKVATQEENHIPNINPQFYAFEVRQDTLDLLIQVANYQDRYGGLTGTFKIGLENQIIGQHQAKTNYLFFVLGILVVMGLYHLSLYFFRKKNKAALYFGLLCFTISLRMLVTDEFVITDFYEDTSFQLSSKISYLTFYLGLLCAAYFFHAVYPQDFSLKVCQVVKWVAFAYSIVTLSREIVFYSKFLTGFQVFTLVFLAYTLYFTVRIVFLRREGSITFLVGVVCIIAATVNDLLHANEVINTFIAIPLGLLAFIFSQTLLLSSLFSKAFQKVEDLSEEMRQINNNLEDIVKQRTDELGSANSELAITNEKLNQVLEETQQTLEIVNEQRAKLAETNREITSSLNYAQRIQQSILPNISLMQRVLPESFVFFRPRDIVSGDFYWFAEIPEQAKIVLAAIDCTGHGVPGAFMTMISHQLLDEIVIEKKITEADQILNSLHRAVRRVMRQEETSSREGMDLSLVVIDKINRKMEFAGAKNPIIYLQEGKLHHLKGDRISIGGERQEQEHLFNKHLIDLSLPTTFYIFSDGYQDQFGGKIQRKFMLSQMKQVFLEIYQAPADFQKQYIEQKLKTWIEEGNESQTDDILVIGVKVL
ncbi:7TM diverse intracellular signaling domain-containing protein [Thermoflexibacter ruber]|uniref:Serine phosphatase RsbU, regulator of sigma subunit n=1 Tax=Thermoflexibacter ruber TaxID=1003 RepID=A0A1I2GHZ9_9BACT|nr:7TM diverse intracellular signaling domain-containing protein [Thermoflexibacter ruber]SFF16366.1 Serine phosphatase RsbU, regulator of sigma subunit [Thermoflexibacter ruber]